MHKALGSNPPNLKTTTKEHSKMDLVSFLLEAIFEIISVFPFTDSSHFLFIASFHLSPQLLSSCISVPAWVKAASAQWHPHAFRASLLTHRCSISQSTVEGGISVPPWCFYKPLSAWMWAPVIGTLEERDVLRIDPPHLDSVFTFLLLKGSGMSSESTNSLWTVCDSFDRQNQVHLVV